MQVLPLSSSLLSIRGAASRGFHSPDTFAYVKNPFASAWSGPCRAIVAWRASTPYPISCLAAPLLPGPSSGGSCTHVFPVNRMLYY